MARRQDSQNSTCCKLITLSETNTASENQWLEDDNSFWGPAYFQGLLLLVSGSVHLFFILASGCVTFFVCIFFGHMGGASASHIARCSIWINFFPYMNGVKNGHIFNMVEIGPR